MVEIKLIYSLGLKILHVVSTLKIVYDLIMISEIRNSSPSSGFLDNSSCSKKSAKVSKTAKKAYL